MSSSTTRVPLDRLYFISWCGDGSPNYAGYFIRDLPGGFVQAQLYSWLTGHETERVVIHHSRTEEYQLFFDFDAFRAAALNALNRVMHDAADKAAGAGSPTFTEESGT